MSTVTITLMSALFLTAPTPKVTASETPAAKAKKALEQNMSFEFEKKTLEEFLTLLKDNLKMDVVFESSAKNLLENSAGSNPNTGEPIPLTLTSKLKNVTVREGVNQILTPWNLRIGTVGGVIMIANEDVLVSKQLRQSVNVLAGSTTNVLAELANKTGTNIVLDPRFKKDMEKVKNELELTDVPLETAVRLVAEVSGYRALRMGNLLFITSLERAKDLRIDTEGPIGADPSAIFRGNFHDVIRPGN
jgi:hypothetical protein